MIREEAGRSCGRTHSGIASSTLVSLTGFAAVCVGNGVVPLEDVEVEVEVEARGGGTSSAGALAKYRTGVLVFCCSALGAGSPLVARMPKSSFRGSAMRASETSSSSETSLHAWFCAVSVLTRLSRHWRGLALVGGEGGGGKLR